MTDSTEEIIIRKSRIDKILMPVFATASAVYGIYMVYLKDWKGLGLIACGIIIYLFWKSDYKKDRPVLRINNKNIWVPGTGRIAWSLIEKIKFNYDFSGPTRSTLEIYKIGQSEPVEIVYIDSISIPRWKLKRILKKLVTVE
jgi:hypothetical protein